MDKDWQVLGADINFFPFIVQAYQGHFVAGDIANQAGGFVGDH